MTANHAAPKETAPDDVMTTPAVWADEDGHVAEGGWDIAGRQYTHLYWAEHVILGRENPKEVLEQLAAELAELGVETLAVHQARDWQAHLHPQQTDLYWGTFLLGGWDGKKARSIAKRLDRSLLGVGASWAARAHHTPDSRIADVVRRLAEGDHGPFHELFASHDKNSLVMAACMSWQEIAQEAIKYFEDGHPYQEPYTVYASILHYIGDRDGNRHAALAAILMREKRLAGDELIAEVEALIV